MSDVALGSQVANLLDDLSEDHDGSRHQFVGWIADRFQERHSTPLPREEAVKYGADCLEAFEQMEAVPFGHPDYDWGEDGAHTLADEEIFAGWEAEA